MTQEALKKMQWHVLTQAQYDALKTKNANDVYAIVDDKGDYSETKLNKMIFNVMSADTYKALETKDPNQIYYVTGENEIIEHKSWTDGSQVSYSTNNNYFYFFESQDYITGDAADMGWGTPSNMTQYASSSQIPCIVYYADTDEKRNGAFTYYVMSTFTPSTSGFYKIHVDMNSLYADEIEYTETKDEDGKITTVTYHEWIPYGFYFSFINPLDANNPTITNSSADKTSTVLDLWNYLIAGKTYYIMIANNGNGTSFYEMRALQAFIYINYMDCTRNSSDQQNADNNVAKALTEISSLNAQGQNLVTAYNNLADKYNTAGIIVTED